MLLAFLPKCFFGQRAPYLLVRIHQAMKLVQRTFSYIPLSSTKAKRDTISLFFDSTYGFTNKMIFIENPTFVSP